MLCSGTRMAAVVPFLVLLYSFVRQSKAGTITSTSSPPPIYNSLANAGVRADYVFSFIPETYLPSGGFL